MANILQTTPSPMTIRDELEQMVLLDLLGPAGGESEEIDERTVRDRYLVGVLAPKRQEDLFTQGRSTPPAPDVDEDDFPPVIPDELSEGGIDSVEDGPTELSIPLPKAIFPSSFGMSFCVDGGAKVIEVTARWGQYLKEVKENQIDQRTGQPMRVWKRYQRGGTKTVNLKVGHVRPLAIDSDPHCEQVYVQGVVRKREKNWIVTLFLINGNEEPKRGSKHGKDSAWLFQPELSVAASDGAPIFCKKLTRKASGKYDQALMAEDDALAMLYRHHVEFAVGHGVSVHAEVTAGMTDQAVRISTKIVPTYEVPRTTPPTPEDAILNPAFGLLAGLERDMKELADVTKPADLRPKLEPLVTAYHAWINSQEARISDPTTGLADHTAAAKETLMRCRATLTRIKAGLDLLATDEQAADAFQFMNRAMWLQRTHSIFSEKVRRGDEVKFEDVDISNNRSWHPFQIAFILLNLPGVTKLDHPERSDRPEAVADLLWFPTGGGKTEAYLGLAAYTMGLRRLQGTVAGREGENGIAVLMRYTLRLLTIQQFQRATTLLCACESIRREALLQGDKRWGETPFRIGLWVGRRTTPNTTVQSAEAVKSVRQPHGQREGGGAIGGSGTPHQLTNCPWCGTKIDKGKNLTVILFSQGAGRTLTYCDDPLGRCLFSAKNAPGEGLPVVVVDEEIYRRLPTLLIATVDKFAQMPWNGAVQMLFGQVNGYCDRHGFRSPEIEDTDSHPKTKTGLPPAKTIAHTPLRPPDLIIQDELHLISGPLGTLVGLYETAIDKLCTWEVNGQKVRPKVIASTATIRKAKDQVHALFLRKVNVFPPHGLDVEDNFFSLQRQPSEKNPGRKYIGICAPGRTVKGALIRVYTAFLSASQALYETKKYGLAADPWMTLVGYFNSMRELGGMRRLVDDDVSTRLRKMERRGLAKRLLVGTDFLQELTSRMGSTQIPMILDWLEIPFDPDKQARNREKAKKRQVEGIPPKPLDVLLATNMLSVGVDVKRLGLMVVAGQPKTTSEYIQATSRVGRNFPGLVCTVFNWARPRDLSHYETFEQYHATFYKHVESLSVTPFSPGALSRGLAALLVSCVRLQGTEFNGNDKAMLLATEANHRYVQDAIELIVERAHQVGKDKNVADFVRAELKRKVDCWQAEAQRTEGGRVLGYKEGQDGVTTNLLHQPGLKRWEEFTCLNSLREVEPTVKLILLDDPRLDDETGSAAVKGEVKP